MRLSGNGVDGVYLGKLAGPKYKEPKMVETSENRMHPSPETPAEGSLQ
jgi:hypothetical protein